MEHNNKLYSDEHDKANILNDYFQSQSFLNDKDVHLPAILPTSVTSDLNSIILTTEKVESVLKILPAGKATGLNGLSNRILRELSVTRTIYPLLFSFQSGITYWLRTKLL